MRDLREARAGQAGERRRRMSAAIALPPLPARGPATKPRTRPALVTVRRDVSRVSSVPSSPVSPGSARVAPVLAHRARQPRASNTERTGRRASDAQISALLAEAVAAADGVAWLTAHARRLPLLTPAEEVTLTRAWRGRRDRAARDRLALSNLRLVLRMASNAQRLASLLDLQDLFQEGVIGLLSALDKYDPDSGNRLSTYASWWIAQAMQRAAANTGHAIRLPQHAYETRKRLLKLRDQFTLTQGREPSMAELAAAAGRDVEQVVTILPAGMTLASLDAPAPGQRMASSSRGDEASSLGELLGAPDADLEFSTSEHEDGDGQWILDVARYALQVGQGTPQQQRERQRAYDIWLARVVEGLTLEAVGARFGVTRERIRQIELKAREKIEPALRQVLAADGRDCYGAYGEELR